MSVTKNAGATKKRAPRVPKPPVGSREARRMAAAILEVLAGVTTPSEAAELLGVSLPRYYALETRGLEGLRNACEPRRRGRQQTAESRNEALQKEVERLTRECNRQGALARAAGRAVGLSAPKRKAARAQSEGKSGGKRRRRSRRPTVRALKAVSRLRESLEPSEAASPSVAIPLVPEQVVGAPLGDQKPWGASAENDNQESDPGTE